MNALIVAGKSPHGPPPLCAAILLPRIILVRTAEAERRQDLAARRDMRKVMTEDVSSQRHGPTRKGGDCSAYEGKPLAGAQPETEEPTQANMTDTTYEAVQRCRCCQWLGAMLRALERQRMRIEAANEGASEGSNQLVVAC